MIKLIKSTFYKEKLTKLRLAWFILNAKQLSFGVKCREFEKRFSAWQGRWETIMVNSGSSANLALIQALLNLGWLKKGDRVGFSALGWSTTVMPLIELGLTPVPIDIELSTLNISSKKIPTDIKALFVTNLLGWCGDMDRIAKKCKDNKIILLEDNCFVGNTKIKTINGDKNIRDIKAGEMVLTRKGYKKVLISQKTGRREVIKKLGLIATPEHPIITTSEVKRLDILSDSDIIYIWNEKLSFIEEKSITDIQTQSLGSEGFTIGDIVKLFLFRYIDKFGLITMEKYPRECSFIIKMIIRLTMLPKTLNVLLQRNIPVNILQQKEKLLPGKILRLQEKKLDYGRVARRVGKPIESQVKKHGQKIRLNCIQQFALFARRIIKHIIQQGQFIALGNVKVVEDVYNLKIEEEHEFFANNILVHNCEALGTIYKGRKTGNFGLASTFSFYVGHHLSTIEGGAVCTDDAELATMLRIVRAHGWDRNLDIRTQEQVRGKYDIGSSFYSRYTFYANGYNLRPTEIQGFLGLTQLPYLDKIIKERKINYLMITGKSIPEEYWLLSNFAIPIICRTKKERDEIVRQCEGKIEVRPIVGGNLTMQPFYPSKAVCPNATIAHERGLYIGNNPDLTPKDMTLIRKVVYGD